MIKKFLFVIVSLSILISFLPAYAENSGELKQYIVVLETPPIVQQSKDGISVMSAGTDAIKESEIEIADEQKVVIDKIANINEEKINVVDQLDTVLNCIIIESENLDIDEISKLPGVKRAYEDCPLELSPVEPDLKETYFVSSANSSSRGAVTASPYSVEGIKGEKMLIAVIDAGFDENHAAFALSEGVEVRLSEAKAKSLITQNGLTGVYLNAKIPYFKTTGTSTISHGTHVAGIVAGNNSVIQGAAPEAQLMLIEVSNTSGKIYYGPVVSGIEDAVKMGADCINISLGSTATFTDYSGDKDLRDAINNANSAGVTVVHAAGNDNRNMFNGTYDTYDGTGMRTNLLYTKNPDYKRTGEYATDKELLVGSLEKNDFSYMVLNMENSDDYIQVLGSNRCTEWTATEKFNALAYRPDGVYIVNCGDGEGDFPSAVNGHIAIIKRDISNIQQITDYTTLMKNAFAAGAAGVILANDFPSTDENYNIWFGLNISESYSGNNLIIGTTSHLADLIIEKFDETGKAKLNGAKMYYPDKPSEFSSWGVTNDLRLVPSISAYGTSVYSAFPGNKYALNSGTSMAAPYISACAALVRQGLGNAYSVEEANDVAKNLMMATADMPRQPQTGNLYTSEVYQSPRQVGLGNVNPQAALNAQCMILGSSGLPKLDMKEIKTNVINVEFSLRNITNSEAVYTADCETMTDGYGVLSGVPQYVIKDEMRRLENAFSLTDSEYVTDNTITVPAYSTVTVSGTIRLNADELSANSEIFTNGFFIDGIINLYNDISSDLHCAVMGFYGNWNAPPMIDPYIGTGGSYYNQTAFYRENGVMAGVNAASEQPVLDLDKLCVGENFIFDYVPLRNIKSVMILINDTIVARGTPYFKFENYEYGPQINSRSQKITQISTEGENQFRFGGYNGYGTAYQVYSIPFITDLTPPTVDASYEINGDNIVIDITASDNYYLQYIDTDAGKIVLDNEKGGTDTAQLSLARTDADITIDVFDYADNSIQLSISTVIKDDNGNIYTSLKNAVESAGVGDTVLTVLNYCETIAETVVIPEDKHITLSGSAQFKKSDLLSLPSIKVLGSLTYDDTVTGLEVSVVPQVEEFNVENGEMSLVLSSAAKNPFASVFAASYDGNGALVDCIRVQDENINPVITLKPGEKYKIFVWDTKTLMPYRNVAE